MGQEEGADAEGCSGGTSGHGAVTDEELEQDLEPEMVTSADTDASECRSCGCCCTTATEGVRP